MKWSKQQHAEVEPMCYSLEQACNVIGIGRSAIYEAINSGELRAVKRGRRTLILKEDMVRWINALPKLGQIKRATQSIESDLQTLDARMEVLERDARHSIELLKAIVEHDQSLVEQRLLKPFIELESAEKWLRERDQRRN